MKKLASMFFALSMILVLTGCTMDNIADTLNMNTEGITDSFSEQFDEIGEGIDEKISEKMDETIDGVSTAAEEAIEDAKDKAIEKVQEKTEEQLSTMTDDLLEDIGEQIDKLMDYRPGLFFEEASEVTFEQDGIQMNAYWEATEIAGDITIHDSGAISLEENADTTYLPSGSIVTISYFDLLPEEVTIFNLKNEIQEEVTVSVMENPLTGKSTYSFEIVFDEGQESTYLVCSKFEGIDEFKKVLKFNKQ